MEIQAVSHIYERPNTHGRQSPYTLRYAERHDQPPTTKPSGIEATLKLARDTMFWPKMTTNIKDRVSNCDVCIQHSESRIREPMQTHDIPKLPLEIRDKYCDNYRSTQSRLAINNLSNK